MHSMHESFVFFFVIIFKPLGRNRLFTGLTTPMRYGAATNDRHSVLHNSEWGREAWALPVLRKIILSLATFQRFTIAALWPLHSFFPKKWALTPCKKRNGATQAPPTCWAIRYRTSMNKLYFKVLIFSGKPRIQNPRLSATVISNDPRFTPTDSVTISVVSAALTMLAISAGSTFQFAIW